MIEALNISLKKRTILQPVNLIAAGYIIVAIIALQNYLSLQSSSLLLGMIALPFVLQNCSARKKSYRYAWATFVCMLLCFFIPVKTLLYLTICFALIFFKESFYGKTGLLVPIIVIFASPVFQYVAYIFSFPLRMELTHIAGQIFNLLNYPVEVQGNIIIHQGNEFSVDPACMGLNMMTTSLLLGVILIAFYQTKFKSSVSKLKILLYLAIILLLNVIANLFRIVLLVYFNILPETMSHDIAGIGCLLVYVFLPAILLAAFLAKRSHISEKENALEQSDRVSYKAILFHLFIVASVSLLACKIFNADTFDKFKVPSQEQVTEYSIMSYAPGIVKLERNDALIYVKYIRGFYDTEHNPMICWTGSGYQFETIKNDEISDRNVFTATLTNGNDKLYSAWWYDNGRRSTTDQFYWRWDLLSGADYYVVINVTCSKKEDLKNEIQKIFQKQTLAPFFKKNNPV